jgi:hypothetical protein
VIAGYERRELLCRKYKGFLGLVYNRKGLHTKPQTLNTRISWPSLQSEKQHNGIEGTQNLIKTQAKHVPTAAV